MSTDIFGQDIRLGDDWQALVAADGSLVLTQGEDTGVQDIKLRIWTFVGRLWFDREFGSMIPNWIKEENTLVNRIGFEQEVKRCINSDPRVALGSVTCSVTRWNEEGITARATFRFIDEDHTHNLVVSVDAAKTEVVVADVNPADI